MSIRIICRDARAEVRDDHKVYVCSPECRVCRGAAVYVADCQCVRFYPGRGTRGLNAAHPNCPRCGGIGRMA